MTTFKVPWGAKVSKTFIDRLAWIVDDLDIGYGIEDGIGKMMGCMAWESGRTFDASIINKAGSGATGLIQFMPKTAISLGTTVSALAKMTEEDQLNYVWKYFAPYKGKLKTLGDIYAAILWPKGVGKPDDFVYWAKASMATTYRQNAGIDADKNGVITKAEATAKVTKLYEEGFEADNVSYYGNSTEPKPETDQSPLVAPGIAERVGGDNPYWQEAVFDTKPNVPIATKVSKAAAGWQGNFAGIGLIVGSLLVNPSFSDALGKFTTRLANGEGSWGALAALIGAGLIAYRGKASK